MVSAGVAPSARAAAGSRAGSRVGIRRVYDGPPGTGRAVLVDRVWPRGVRKAQLGDVVWLREVAPSDELRKWFGHRPERWEEFRSRYRRELEANAAFERLVEMARSGPITLLYGARDEERNQAVVLREMTLERLG